MYHTPKKGVSLGVGHTGSFFSSLWAAAPAFPKQQAPPGWGQFNKNIMLTFFPRWGLFCNMTCGYLYKNECYNEAAWLLFQCVWVTWGWGLGWVLGSEGGRQYCPCPDEGFPLRPIGGSCFTSGWMVWTVGHWSFSFFYILSTYKI